MVPYIPPSITTLVKLGPVEIHAFGVLVATGILVGANRTQYRARQLGMPHELTASLITTVVLMGFLVAHVFDVLAYQTTELLRLPWLPDLPEVQGRSGFPWFSVTWGPQNRLFMLLNIAGGLSSFGGFLGALIGLLLWTRYEPGGHRRAGAIGFFLDLVHWKRREEPIPVIVCADSLLFGLAFGWFFGRMGCFTAHDHPGAYTDFFLAVAYPDGARHDLGLDEALFAAVLATLFAVLGLKNRRLGLYAAIACSFYGPVRFVLDFLRVQNTAGADPRYFGLTPAQYGSALVMITGLVIAARVARRTQPTPPPVAP